MKEKSIADWDRYSRLVREHDPYQHPLGVHNCHAFYDHHKGWITHQSIQHSDLTRTGAWRKACPKPVVVDECLYEGDVPKRWGNITAQEMVHRFWQGVSRGGYVGHSETYLHPQDILWWSKGGVLHGQSAPRIAFLRKLVEEGPAVGLEPIDSPNGFPAAGKADRYVLVYLENTQPRRLELSLPAPGRWRAELIDTWEMTLTPLPGEHEGRCELELPFVKPYQALRLQRID